MTNLEDRIRTTLNATAQRLPDREEGTVVPPTKSKRLPRARGPAVAAAAMVAVLVMLGGSVFWLSVLDRQPNDSAGSPLAFYPIPRHVPASADLVYGDYAVPDPASPNSVEAVIARASAGGFIDGVVVTVFDTSEVGMGIPDGEPVEVNGQRVVLTRSKGGVSLWWGVGDIVVSVRSPEGDASLAMSIAAAVRIDDDQPFDETNVSFESLPIGLTVFAPPQLVLLEPFPHVEIRDSAGGAGNAPSATIDVVHDNVEHVIGEFGSGSIVDIGGIAAYQVATRQGVAFAWSPAENVTVTVSGTYPAPEVRAIAEGLTFVAEAEWRDHFDGSGPQLPTTTTRVP